MSTSSAGIDIAFVRRRGIWLAVAAVGAATVAISVFAESTAFEWRNLRGWAPDVAVGWVLVGCGLTASAVLRESRVGALMVAAGAAWFVGNFDGVQPPSLAWVAQHAEYVYLALLVQAALIALPGVSGPRRIALPVAAAYLLVLWPVGSATDVAVRIMLLGALVLVVTARLELQSRYAFASRRNVAGAGSALLGLTFVGLAVARLALPTDGYENVTFWSDLALCLSACLLLFALATAAAERDRVTDLVIDLGERRSASIRDVLRRALDDPTLEVGYRVPDVGTFVDQAGRLLSVPPEDPGRVATALGEDIILLHDRTLLADEQMLDAVAAAARLAAANVRLQAELRAQIAELHASRRRLAIARDEGRRRLQEELRRGAERDLEAIAEGLATLQPNTRGVDAALERSRGLLAHALADLRRIGSGLHPQHLADEGLTKAASTLAALAPIPVDVSICVEELDAPVEATAYFVCSEALANVAKHSGATAASLSITQDRGTVRIVVADDGLGGAARMGSGLRGLAERVEALGGSLRVLSPPDGGTRVVAEIPLATRT